jgi:hypothetical protein
MYRKKTIPTLLRILLMKKHYSRPTLKDRSINIVKAKKELQLFHYTP